MITCDRCGKSSNSVVTPEGEQAIFFIREPTFYGEIDACEPCWKLLRDGMEKIKNEMDELRLNRCVAWHAEWSKNCPHGNGTAK